MAISYWQKLHLQFDPFVSEHPGIGNFVSPQWQKLFDLVCHLSSADNGLILITGHEGIGKTRLLKQFTEQLDATTGVCKIQGDKSIEPDVLRYLLAKHLGITLTNAGIDHFKDQLLLQCEKMHQCDKTYLLIIDDAHLLPDRTIKIIIDLLHYLQSLMNELPLHILLFGRPALEATVAELNNHPFDQQKIHVLKMNPLAFDSMIQYLRERMQNAGFQNELPFSEEELNEIYRMSEGVPAKINFLARQMLEKQLLTKKKVDRSVNHRRFNKVLGSAVIVMVGLLITFLVVRQRQQENWVERTIANPSDFANVEQAWVTVQEQGNKLTAVQEEEDDDDDDVNELIYAEKSESQPSLQVQEPVEVEKVKDEIAEVPIEKSTPKPQEKIALKSLVKPKEKKVAQTNSVQQQILNRPHGHYVLQLVAASDQQRVKQFVTDHKLNDALILSIRRDNKPWYIVLYGDYPSIKHAQQAIPQLPNLVQAEHPWARQIGDLQKNIRSNRVG